MRRFFHRLRRRWIIWWNMTTEREIKRKANKSARFVAARLWGDWEHVPRYARDMIKMR